MKPQRKFIPDRSSGDGENEIEILPEKFPSNTSRALFEALKFAIEREQYVRKQQEDAQAFDEMVEIIHKIENEGSRVESIRSLLIDLLRTSENFQKNPQIQEVLKRYRILYEAIAEQHARDFLSGNTPREEMRVIEAEIRLLSSRFPENPKIRRIAESVFFLSPLIKEK